MLASTTLTERFGHFLKYARSLSVSILTEPFGH